MPPGLNYRISMGASVSTVETEAAEMDDMRRSCSAPLVLASHAKQLSEESACGLKSTASV